MVVASGTGEFGHLLAGHRVTAGLTQEDLAATAGVSLRALGDMERGRTRGPQRRTVQALAAALGLDGPQTAALERAAQSGRPRGVRQVPPQGPAIGAASPSATGPGGPSAAPTGPSAGPSAGPHLAAGAPGPGTAPDQAPAGGPGPRTDPPVPGALALPRDLADFTAREQALADLAALTADRRPAHPRVVLISGQPGLGKTAFALHAAHALAPAFPDGQLSLDLGGMAATPLPAREALGQVLRALGVKDGAVPAGTEERAGLFRALVRDRRLVLVLDDAVDESQVRPLLPGAGPAVTIVTSRHALPGLEAVHRLRLDVLSPVEATALLARIAGPERVEAAPSAAADLARLCGYLPLALRIAGQRLVARPQQPVAQLTRQLAAEENRLDLLETGDLAVRPAFELSYRRLPDEARLVLRRCALTAGQDFTAAVLAHYAGLSAGRTELVLEQLIDAGLVQPATPERYRLHDLVRLYAGERLAADEPAGAVAEARTEAGRRLLREAAEHGLRFDPDASAGSSADDPALLLTESARWLEEEHPEWLAALYRAQREGRHREVIDTAEAMHWFSDRLLSWDLWGEVFQLSVDAARACGDRRAEAVHVNYLAWTYITCLHRYQRGIELAGEGLELAQELGDHEQQGWALTYLGSGLRQLRRHREASESYQRAADAFAEVDNRAAMIGRLVTLRGAATCLRELGRAEEAVDVRRRALAGALELVERWSSPLMHLLAAMTAHELGQDRAALKRWPAAEKAYRQALVHYEAVGRPDSMTKALTELGTALIEQGRADEAREILTDALTDLSADGRPGRAVAP
ncbi:tetratricopeptide repeat protein [Kitasatospora sp. NPDC059827]|uniref:tetratricopeptide repeat protein n=1 Tax=Kitasatospora sp. NPDC059827 TaxID=3346964 RepID=UPI0036604C91